MAKLIIENSESVNDDNNHKLLLSYGYSHSRENSPKTGKTDIYTHQATKAVVKVFDDKSWVTSNTKPYMVANGETHQHLVDHLKNYHK